MVRGVAQRLYSVLARWPSPPFCCPRSRGCVGGPSRLGCSVSFRSFVSAELVFSSLSGPRPLCAVTLSSLCVLCSAAWSLYLLTCWIVGVGSSLHCPCSFFPLPWARVALGRRRLRVSRSAMPLLVRGWVFGGRFQRPRHASQLWVIAPITAYRTS